MAQIFNLSNDSTLSVMSMRFITYIKYKEQDFALYFKQDSGDLSKANVSVYRRDGETIRFDVFRNCKNTWESVIPQVPEVASEIISILQSYFVNIL